MLLKDLKYTILLLLLSKEQKDIFGSVYIKSQMLTIAYRLFTQKKVKDLKVPKNLHVYGSQIFIFNAHKR